MSFYWGMEIQYLSFGRLPSGQLGERTNKLVGLV
jgi:hypothetical protein